jgi:hypothetical protein
MAAAMTFVKGMAHQGLEMASDGIFVRNMEGSEESKKISFKEIYPALSMTPVEGIRVENLAPAANSKKRTSSVKTALFNRNAKEGGKPARTARYITGIAILALVSALLVFSMAGDSGSVADTYTVDIDDGCTGLVFYDDAGSVIAAPGEVSVNSTLRFVLASGDMDIGYVTGGTARLLTPGDDGIYSVTVSHDLKLEPLFPIASIDGAQITVYNFASPVADRHAVGYQGYMTLSEYEDASGGLFVGSNAVLRVTADEGKYLSIPSAKSDAVLWKTITTSDPSLEGVEARDMPSSGFIDITFNGDYYIDGQYVSGTVQVITGKTLNVVFASAYATGTKIIVTYENGSTSQIDVKEDGNTFRLYYCYRDMVIDYRLGDFSRSPMRGPPRCSVPTAVGPSRGITSATARSAGRTSITRTLCQRGSGTPGRMCSQSASPLWPSWPAWWFSWCSTMGAAATAP